MQIKTGLRYTHKADKSLTFVPVMGHDDGFFGAFSNGQNSWVSNVVLERDYATPLSVPAGWSEDGNSEIFISLPDVTIRMDQETIWFIHRPSMTAAELPHAELLECLQFLQSRDEEFQS